MSNDKRGKRSKYQKTEERSRNNNSAETCKPDAPTNGERKAQRKLITKFVGRTLEKGPTGLRAEFQGMKRSNDFGKMKAFKEAQEFGRNRYKDVGCLDNCRVKLTTPWPNEYIHANYVSTPNNPKRFICTQAPLEKTCADFWFMCLQERVETIFMLCNFTEKGTKKCHEYFPKSDSLTFEEGEFKIVVKFENSKNVKFKGKGIKANVVETQLTVEGPNDMSIKLTHLHWIDWPDRGVPPADLAIIELLNKARQSKGPIAVHCSAGIGRTGSVVMIEYIMEQMLSNQQIDDTDKIMLKIREQRNNSVQTDHQYLFVHQVIMNYFRFRKLFDPTIEALHDDFTKNYLKLVI
ncbi:unnamed protein product [Caenorhabditis angaria]|uniref:Tyrosine-protein phosphatase n=1 Tax=Caenorhabditis angaria TaxID=860376 RepID=A0A9P1ITB4_9PELO|nr:unnamed protein product [Caenorhabditis angaria]